MYKDRDDAWLDGIGLIGLDWMGLDALDWMDSIDGIRLDSIGFDWIGWDLIDGIGPTALRPLIQLADIETMTAV